MYNKTVVIIARGRVAFNNELSVYRPVPSVTVFSSTILTKIILLRKGMDIAMIVLITGATHTGKTVLAQKLLEQYKYPYLSIDHLKMGLIRSQNTALTPMSGIDELTNYLWPIVREIIKTAIENHQNLIVEGCYLPFDWEKDFSSAYAENIRFYCLVMSERYIRAHFDDIRKYASVLENRADDAYCTEECLLAENARYLRLAKQYHAVCVLADSAYEMDIDLETEGR